jgi:hypothetical protein
VECKKKQAVLIIALCHSWVLRINWGVSRLVVFSTFYASTAILFIVLGCYVCVCFDYKALVQLTKKDFQL